MAVRGGLTDRTDADRVVEFLEAARSGWVAHLYERAGGMVHSRIADLRRQGYQYRLRETDAFAFENGRSRPQRIGFVCGDIAPSRWGKGRDDGLATLGRPQALCNHCPRHCRSHDPVVLGFPVTAVEEPQ